METQTPPVPPPPPFATPTALADDEEDVDLADDEDDQGDEEQLRQPTIPEGVTYLGDAPDLKTFFRQELEDLVDPSVAWILDCLDIGKVRARYESDGSRLVVERGHVYRLGIDDDRPGAYMPTRGS